MTTEVLVTPEYVSIQCIRDICEPWLEIWGGDEWGDSMWNLHGAAHTSYGLSDQECAVIAKMLVDNVIIMKDWVDNEGSDYGFLDNFEHARKESTQRRDYWLKGGNLGDWADGPAKAKATIDTLPDWMFENE